MNKLISLTIALTLIACSRGGSQQTGGQDGGGGESGSSTSEQVRAAITQAYTLASVEDYSSNVFSRFFLAKTGGQWDESSDFEPSHLYPALFPHDVDSPDYLNVDFASPPLKALLAQPPILRAAGDCQQGTRVHADASTSNFSLNGHVCFSIGNLRRLPPNALLGEIMGLMLHEAIHLSGVKTEQEPERWQHEFTNYFNWRFGGIQAEHVAADTKAQLALARTYLGFALNMADNPQNLKMSLVLGAWARMLISLPHAFDPVALNLAVNPKNPDLVSNYSNSILALYESAEYTIGHHHEDYKFRPHQAKQIVTALIKDMDRVTENFAAYLDGIPDKPNRGSHCLLKQTSGLPVELQMERDNRGYGPNDWLYRNTLPPRVCAPGTVEESASLAVKNDDVL